VKWCWARSLRVLIARRRLEMEERGYVMCQTLKRIRGQGEVVPGDAIEFENVDFCEAGKRVVERISIG